MTEVKHTDIKEVQIVFFVSNNDLSNKLDVASKVSEGFKDRSELMPTILPIPNDAPPEFPRIMFQSSNDSISCNISLNRIDLILKTTKDNEKDIKDLVEENVDFLTSIVTKSLAWNVLRMALVIRSRIPTTDGAANFMKKFVTDPMNKDSIDLQIHRLTHETISKLESNYWLRLISQSKDPEGESVIVISDINTIRDVEKLDDKLIGTFFENALDKSTETMKELI